MTATAIVARSARRAWTLVHPGRTRVSAAARRQAFADIPTLEDITLHTADGLSLRGWFAAGSRRAVVVFVHGLWGNRLTLFPEARLLFRHGYGVLLFDSRGSGDSDGDVVTWGDREQLDARAAVDFVSSRSDVDPGSIAVLGFSVGASTVAMEVSRDPRPRAAILCATWSSFNDEIRDKFATFGPLSWGPAMFAMRWAGVHPSEIRPIDYLPTVGPRPLLMITGTLDDDTPVQVEERVFLAAAEPKQLWIVQGARHGEYLSVAPSEYESRVVAFLDQALVGSAGTASGSGLAIPAERHGR
jgi:alpha-beta hydrolase superfamily lysophospholipase